MSSFEIFCYDSPGQGRHLHHQTRHDVNKIMSKFVSFERTAFSLASLKSGMTSLVPVVMCLSDFDSADIKQKLISYVVCDSTLYAFVGGHKTIKLVTSSMSTTTPTITASKKVCTRSRTRRL
jgi:hypothetical protein